MSEQQQVEDVFRAVLLNPIPNNVSDDNRRLIEELRPQVIRPISAELQQNKHVACTVGGLSTGTICGAIVGTLLGGPGGFALGTLVGGSLGGTGAYMHYDADEGHDFWTGAAIGCLAGSAGGLIAKALPTALIILASRQDLWEIVERIGNCIVSRETMTIFMIFLKRKGDSLQ